LFVSFSKGWAVEEFVRDGISVGLSVGSFVVVGALVCVGFREGAGMA